MAPAVDSIKPGQIIEWFEREKHDPRYPHHQRLLTETNPETRPYDPISGNFTQCITAKEVGAEAAAKVLTARLGVKAYAGSRMD
jgi:hypothetical protein